MNTCGQKHLPENCSLLLNALNQLTDEQQRQVIQDRDKQPTQSREAFPLLTFFSMVIYTEERSKEKY